MNVFWTHSVSLLVVSDWQDLDVSSTTNVFTPISLLMYSFLAGCTQLCEATHHRLAHTTRSDLCLDWIFSKATSVHIFIMQYCLVQIVTCDYAGYRRIRVQFPVWLGDFSLLHSSQTGSGAHPHWLTKSHIQWVPGLASPEVKCSVVTPSTHLI
jgi:hypothetical protein